MLGHKSITLYLDDVRLAMYGSFIFIIIMGFLLTKFGSEILDEEPSLLYWWYGQSNVCLLFDFAPSKYVLAPLWGVTVVIWMVMTYLLYVRQVEAYLAGQMGIWSLRLLNYWRIQESLCVIFFSTIFAVSPDIEQMSLGVPTTIIVHSVPFLFMMLGLSTLAFSDGVYDVSTGFASLKGVRTTPTVSARYYILLTYPVLLFAFSITKMTLLVNGVSKGPVPHVPYRYLDSGNYTSQYPCVNNDWPHDPTCGGLAWCSNCPDFAPTANAVDKIWTVLVLVPPVLKSLYCSIFIRDRIFSMNIKITPNFYDKDDKDMEPLEGVEEDKGLVYEEFKVMKE